jgi:hypothetical protein
MSAKNVTTRERASQSRFEIEAELLRALELARTEYESAGAEDKAAARERYLRALTAFSGFILRGKIPEGFEGKPEPETQR